PVPATRTRARERFDRARGIAHALGEERFAELAHALDVREPLALRARPTGEGDLQIRVRRRDALEVRGGAELDVLRHPPRAAIARERGLHDFTHDPSRHSPGSSRTTQRVPSGTAS